MATLLNCKATTFPTGNFRENICEDPHNLPQIQLASFLIQPASTRLLSPGPISRRWKRQSMPALSCPIPSQISVCQDKGCYVRFGSKADVKPFNPNVCYPPESGHCSERAGCPLSARSSHLKGKRPPQWRPLKASLGHEFFRCAG